MNYSRFDIFCSNEFEHLNYSLHIENIEIYKMGITELGSSHIPELILDQHDMIADVDESHNN